MAKTGFRTFDTHNPQHTLPLSDAREEKPLVVEMLSSSCCELLSLISLTREKLGEAPTKGAEEVEGWEKRELGPLRAREVSKEGKWR